SRPGPRLRRRCAQGSRRRRRNRQQMWGSCSSMRTRLRRPPSRPSSPSCGSCSVSELTLVEAINDAFHTELARDDSVLVMGEDVGRAGGVFRATAGLRDKFGAERCVDSPEAYYAHTPGVKVAIPSTPADAKGLLAAAIRDPDPVIVLEPKLHYRTMRGDVPAGEHVVALGRARVARDGDDATIVAYGSMVPVAEAAAESVAEVASVEVLDIRTLKPLDEEALLESVGKTGRAVIVQEAPRTAGYGAELAAILAEKAMLDLRAPVIRVTGYDVPYPYWQIEDAYMPSVERVVAAVRKTLEL